MWKHLCVEFRLTHGDVGQLVSGAVRVDAVEMRTITVHSTQNQSRPNVTLIPEQTQSSTVTPHFSKQVQNIERKLIQYLVRKGIRVNDLLLYTSVQSNCSALTFI